MANTEINKLRKFLRANGSVKDDKVDKALTYLETDLETLTTLLNEKGSELQKITEAMEVLAKYLPYDYQPRNCQCGNCD